MDQHSVFYEEWLRSLREQYKQVVRNDDRVTLLSLTAVMQNVGFRDEELTQLRLEATMHIDDVGDDYRADMNILDETKAATAHPAECICPACLPVDERLFDAEGQPIPPATWANDEEAASVFPVADIEDADERVEAEPVTFEDSVAADALRTEAAESGSDSVDNMSEADPDAPAQMSLF